MGKPMEFFEKSARKRTARDGKLIAYIKPNLHHPDHTIADDGMHNLFGFSVLIYRHRNSFTLLLIPDILLVSPLKP